MNQDSQPEIEGLRHRRALGWLYVCDDGIEWSDQHPHRSGQVPDARLVRRATNAELLAALKDAWEAHSEAVQSEARLGARASDAEAKLSALLSLKEGGGLGSSSAESGALLASQASCSAAPSSTGKGEP